MWKNRISLNLLLSLIKNFLKTSRISDLKSRFSVSDEIEKERE